MLAGTKDRDLELGRGAGTHTHKHMHTLLRTSTPPLTHARSRPLVEAGCGDGGRAAAHQRGGAAVRRQGQIHCQDDGCVQVRNGGGDGDGDGDRDGDGDGAEDWEKRGRGNRAIVYVCWGGAATGGGGGRLVVADRGLALWLRLGVSSGWSASRQNRARFDRHPRATPHCPHDACLFARSPSRSLSSPLLQTVHVPFFALALSTPTRAPAAPLQGRPIPRRLLPRRLPRLARIACPRGARHGGSAAHAASASAGGRVRSVRIQRSGPWAGARWAWRPRAGGVGGAGPGARFGARSGPGAWAGAGACTPRAAFGGGVGGGRRPRGDSWSGWDGRCGCCGWRWPWCASRRNRGRRCPRHAGCVGERLSKARCMCVGGGESSFQSQRKPEKCRRRGSVCVGGGHPRRERLNQYSGSLLVWVRAPPPTPAPVAACASCLLGAEGGW